jgi:hypothetical protein
MAQLRGDQRYGRAVVDGMGSVDMPEPVHGSGRVDAGAPGRGLDVDGPIGQGMARVTAPAGVSDESD